MLELYICNKVGYSLFSRCRFSCPKDIKLYFVGKTSIIDYHVHVLIPTHDKSMLDVLSHQVRFFLDFMQELYICSEDGYNLFSR